MPGILLYNSEIVTQQMIDDRLEVLPLMNQQVLASMQIPNLTKQLQEVRVPILSIWGLSDQFIPIRGSETLEKCCSDVRTISFKECGHWVMIEKAEEFNNYCISFLKNS
jgi:4,5:9,10-diseco-3-hydroxy-5,9,17-trioxoandrosta-1(10),2-diene-4-oate hydrolase